MRSMSLPALILLLMVSTTSAQQAMKTTYDQHVLPILRDKCLSCHNQDKARGGLDLSTYTKTMEGGGSGVVVKSGEPDTSRIFTMTTHKVEPKMPPNAPMIAKESIDTLRKWIVDGALENSGSKPVPVRPKIEIALKSITRGRPPVPPMPTVKLRLDPFVVAPRLNAVTSLAANPWSPLIAVGGQKQVLLYNADTSELVGILPFPHGQVNSLKFSRNGSLLLGAGGRGGHSGKATLWNVTTGEVVIEVGAETDAILSADISPDQTMIATGGPSKMVRIYSTQDATMIRQIKKHTDWIYCVEFSPDGVLLATGDRSSGLWVWEANTGRDFYNLRGHTAGVCDISWRDDSNVLASCSEDGTIRQWEMENGTMIKNWPAHGGGAQAVKFGHDNRLVSAGRDKVVKMWDANGVVQRQFDAFPDLALRSAFTHDQTKVLGGDWTGLLKSWSAVDGKALVAFSVNPPTIAEQLANATKELAVKQTAFDQANVVWTQVNANLVKANTDLAAAQKAMVDTATAAKVAVDALPVAKVKLDQTVAVFTAAQLKMQALDIKVKAFVEATTKIKAAADANKANPELQAAAAQSKQIADQAMAEFVAAQKVVTDTDVVVKQLQAVYAVATKLVTDTDVAAKAAAAQVPVQTLAVKVATDAIAPAKVKFDTATAELNAIKAIVEKLKATTVVTK